MPTPAPVAVSFLDRPGRRLSPGRLAALVTELRAVAATCFDTLPEYGVVAGDHEALDAAVLTLARNPAGDLVGFCAARRLDVPGVGEVYHLGLTCVAPEARSGGLTHALLSKNVVGHLLRTAPWRGVWFTNVASVLSSLGNVALYFEDVHPSPYGSAEPTPVHEAIALAVAQHHRGRLHLRDDAHFDLRRFVFRGGNHGNVFHKRSSDDRYHHREAGLTRWYAALADLDRGDAVLQVGRVSLGGFVRYAARRTAQRLPGLHHFIPTHTTLPSFTPKHA